ncbi:MAG TPA: PaaI family thioesterase [Aeromicrobium sp.]|nr:PaaI family thioesterase [Aeromicrobium sp.]
MPRERTYSWADPLPIARLATQMDGIDFVQKLADGDVPPPPVAVTVGLTPVAWGDGWSRIELQPQEWHYNPLGTVHGGILSTLADTALGIAVHTTLPRGTSYTSLDLIMKFTRSATVESGLLTCEGRVVTSGRRVATAEATVTDVDGRVIAHAVSTCMLFPAQGGDAGSADAAGRLRGWSRSSRIGSTQSIS